MKKKTRLLTCFFCVSFMVLTILTSCSMSADKTQDATSYSLFENKQMKYSIIYPFTATDDVKSAAKSCYRELANLVNDEPFYTDDWDAEVTELEILIGDTNRPESQQVKQELSPDSYCIKFVNQKLVVCAAEEWMISNAVADLLQNISYAKDESGEITAATLPQDFCLLYTFDGYTRDRWTLSAFPAYDGGILGDTFFADGVGYNTLEMDITKYKMVCASKTNAEEFKAYADKLTAEGFQLTAAAQTENVIGYWVEKGSDRMYIYYTDGNKEARFILDQGDSMTPDEFSYQYVKQQGDNTTFYLYGLYMDSHGVNIGEKYSDGTVNTAAKNCGMFMLIKLADDSLILIDGADDPQMSKEAAEHLNQFMHRITGKPEEEKITVRCWFITHYHGDHYNGIMRFLTNYHEQYELERVMYNFRQTELPSDIPTFMGEEYLKEYYPDILYHRPHTGETIMLGDVEMDVLFTTEDLINTKTMVFESTDSNNTSTIMRIRIDGKSFMVLGDAYFDAETVLMRNYDASELKADVMQVSHHGLNNLQSLFPTINPSISLYPQSSGGAVEAHKGSVRAVYENVCASTQGGAANVYFAGDETVGVEVVDGEVKVVFEEDVVGAAYDGSNGGAQQNWSVFDPF